MAQTEASEHPLAKWLDRKGVTQADLARSGGTFQPRISNVIAGKVDGFSPRVARRIAKITGIGIERLLFQPSPAATVSSV